MASRTQRRQTSSLDRDEDRIDPGLFSDDKLDLESLSEEDLEDLLFTEEERESKGFFNLPTIAGFSLIMVGIAYIFQQLGLWTGVDLTILASMLPWMAGILIILLGFGVLSWRPGSRGKKRMSARDQRRMRKAEKEEARFESKTAKRSSTSSGRGKLRKSRDKKLAGVAGGIAEYFGIDPTLVRIAFVIGTIASGGPFFLAYLVLSFVMPNQEKPSFEERITIIRDS